MGCQWSGSRRSDNMSPWLRRIEVTQKGHRRSQFTVPAHVPVERVEFVVGAEPANFSRDGDG